MPESEPKPKLIELVAPGGGQGWKAVLKSGKPAVVHEIPIPPAEATAAVPRLQRLFDHRHPALSPVLGWGTDQNGIWIAVEPNEGTPLSSILTRGPMTPPAAAALGAAVLSGVAALHEMGIALGGFGATAVRVTSNGEVPAITPFLPAGEAPLSRPQPYTPAAGVPPVPPGPPPPAPYLSAPRREDGSSRGSVYDAPDRPLQTYPSMPAITFPPAAPAASAAIETPPSTPAVP